VDAQFDDPNLVSCGGLAPVVALAHRAGLGELVGSMLTLKAKGGGQRWSAGAGAGGRDGRRRGLDR
jgi:hypothetical protein